MTPALLAALAFAAPTQADGPEVVLLCERQAGGPLAADIVADLGEIHGARVRFVEGEPEALGDPDVAVLVPSLWLPDSDAWQSALTEQLVDGIGLVVLGVPGDFAECAKLWELAGGVIPAELVDGRCFGDWQAKWIWTPPAEDETPDHHRYVRRVFDVPEMPARARVRMTADNLYTAYLNGARFAYHWSWYDAELWDITHLVRPGENVLAIDARNVDGPGGLLCEVGIEYPSGRVETIASDADWRMSRTPETGWAELGFDDSSWPQPQQVRPYPATWGPIRDRRQLVEGPVHLASHSCTAGIPRRFERQHEIRGLRPAGGALTAAEVRSRPLLVLSGNERPRVAVADGAFGRGSVLSGDSARDLLTQVILWAAGEQPMPHFARFSPPASELRVGDAQARPTWSAALAAPGRRHLTARVEVRGADGAGLRRSEEVDVPGDGLIAERAIPLGPSSDAEGEYALTVTVVRSDGTPLAARHARFAVVNGVNAKLSVPANRYVTAEGYPITFLAEVDRSGERLDGQLRLSAEILDPWGSRVHQFPTCDVPSAGEPVEWTYEPPALECGPYRLRSVLTDSAGQIVDTSALGFHIVAPLDLTRFLATTMRLSPFEAPDTSAIEREIDDIIAHGFNTLTFSAHRLGAEPGSPYDYAEDYAQRRGMAVSYSFQGDFSILRRGAPPEVSVYSPEYADRIRPRIEKAISTAKRVPRLLNVQGYMDEPFQEGERTFDYSEATAAEYERRFGRPLPRTQDVLQDPEELLRYLDFRAAYFPAGWEQSYAVVRELWEQEMPGRRRFWVELTHDSHNTFGAAAGPSGVQYAVDDVFHWGAPFDSVNYDIYPYLSRDYRTGEFAEFPEPRMAGVHMAFAQMRNLARTHDKKLGFWLESGWGDKLKPEAGLAEATWSPRELTYTALGHGCDYLNTFWGIPEDERWWKEYGQVMNEVKSIAPLLARSRRRPARACFIFPRTQHLLLQEEYWNVMVAYEAFLQAYGELDCVHEDQLRDGKLDEYDVVALFDVHCLPQPCAEVLRGWVEAGGLLIADEVPQTDERRQRMATLDGVFGVGSTPSQSNTPVALSEPGHPHLPIVRTYEPAGATPLSGAPTLADGRPAFLRHAFGRGSALLMQFPLKDAYLAHLMEADDEAPEFAALSVLRSVLQAEGSRAGVRSSNPGIEACVRETPEGTLLVLLINHECHRPAAQISVRGAPPNAFVQDLMSGRPIERPAMDDGELVLPAEVPFGQTRLYGIFPGRPTGLAASLEPDRAQPGDMLKLVAALAGIQEADGGSFLMDVAVRGPDRRLREVFSGRRCTAGRALQLDLRLPVNAQRGKWQVSVSLPWTKSEAHAGLRVR